MNQQQILAIVRMLLVALGTFFAGKGFFPADNVSSTVDLLMAVVGPAMVAGSTIWSLYRNTHAGTITAAASLDNVTKIVTDPKTAGAVPSAKVVSPGS